MPTNVEQVQSNIQALLERRLHCQNQLKSIENFLQATREELAEMCGETEQEFSQPVKSPKKTKVGRKSSLDIANQARETCHHLFKKTKQPLAVDDLAIQLIQCGQAVYSDPTKLCNWVFDEVITPLQANGVIEAVGKKFIM